MTLTAQTLGDVARAHAKARGDATALVFEGRSQSYADFDGNTNRVASALLALGLSRSARVSSLGKNSDRYFEILVGASKAGIVLAPINWRLAAPEIVYILQDAGSEVLFVGPEFAELAESVRPHVPKLRTIIALEGGAQGWIGYKDWRDAQSPRDPGLSISAEDIALQLYTSGTTGRPKGATLSHRSLTGTHYRPVQELDPWQRWTSDDVGLIAMPNFHISGTGMGLICLLNGAKGIVAREFDPNTLLDFVKDEGVSRFFAVPAALQIVVRHPRARSIDYSRLKFVLYGAAPIPLELLRECIDVFGCGFVQLYGMTETCGSIVALPPEDHCPEGSPRMRAAGKAMPGVELAVIDEAGNRLPPGQTGEIITRSVANMTGYWNQPEATAQTIDAEGWLRTGDAGYLDADGYVFIQDRVKDMIISGGENVYPAEVENAIFGHPDVADVAVIGVPDAKWGEAVKAIVVRKAGRDPKSEDIIAWARERIAAYKAPKTVDFIDALPRNPSGKVLRRELREPYWAGKDRRVN